MDTAVDVPRRRRELVTAPPGSPGAAAFAILALSGGSKLVVGGLGVIGGFAYAVVSAVTASPSKAGSASDAVLETFGGLLVSGACIPVLLSGAFDLFVAREEHRRRRRALVLGLVSAGLGLCAAALGAIAFVAMPRSTGAGLPLAPLVCLQVVVNLALVRSVMRNAPFYVT